MRRIEMAWGKWPGWFATLPPERQREELAHLRAEQLEAEELAAELARKRAEQQRRAATGRHRARRL